MITEAEFHQALVDVVAEYGPDHVYRYHGGCLYRHPKTGEPLCIIGAALYKLDPEFKPKEGRGAEEVLRAINGRNEPWMDAADIAQTMQDQGGTWGQALAEYECRRP